MWTGTETRRLDKSYDSHVIGMRIFDTKVCACGAGSAVLRESQPGLNVTES